MGDLEVSDDAHCAPSSGAVTDPRDSEGGGVGPSAIATVMIEDEHPKSPLVFHIPHSSTEIPRELRSCFLLNDQQLSDELLAMTDRYTDELFATYLGPCIRFPVSRLVVDPERFVRDAEEPMAARGMGVVYTRTSSGGTLRRAPSPVERDELIRRYYDPHYQALE